MGRWEKEGSEQMPCWGHMLMITGFVPLMGRTVPPGGGVIKTLKIPNRILVANTSSVLSQNAVEALGLVQQY